MSITYVLIICEVGTEKSILAELKSLESVKEISGLFGSYDIIVKLEAASEEKLKKLWYQKFEISKR